MSTNDQARYIVRITKFDCVDESGVDWTGSDEPVWVFTAKQDNSQARTTRSKEFSVDSGDTRRFETDGSRNVIWPKPRASEGALGPISLSIQLWEIDHGDPENIAKKTELAFNAAGVIPGLQWVREAPPIVRDQIANLFADDLMGSRTLFFSKATLARRLPRVGDRYVGKYRFGGNSGDLPFEVAGGPDYDLYIEITRIA
jgi:hypothetical protein